MKPTISEEAAAEERQHDDRAARIGLIKLRPGDVVPHGGKQYIVQTSTSCRAHCLPLAAGERAEFFALVNLNRQQ